MTKHEEFWSLFFNKQAEHETLPSKCLCFSNKKNRDSIHEIIISFLDNNYEKAIDAGAGNGDLCLRLLNHCKHISALDISSNMVDLMKKNLAGYEDSISIYKGSAVNPPFPDSAFDLIIASELLQYVPFSQTFFRLIDLLKPSGTMIVSMPNKTHPIIKLAHIRRKGLFNGIGIEELKEIMKNTDIECSVTPLFLNEGRSYSLGKTYYALPDKKDIKGANRFVIKVIKLF